MQLFEEEAVALVAKSLFNAKVIAPGLAALSNKDSGSYAVARVSGDNLIQ